MTIHDVSAGMFSSGLVVCDEWGRVVEAVEIDVVESSAAVVTWERQVGYILRRCWRGL